MIGEGRVNDTDGCYGQYLTRVYTIQLYFIQFMIPITQWLKTYNHYHNNYLAILFNYRFYSCDRQNIYHYNIMYIFNNKQTRLHFFLFLVSLVSIFIFISFQATQIK